MGITPEKYQAYARGEISLEEASKPMAPKTPSASPVPTPQQASQGSYGAGAAVYAPPAPNVPAPQYTPDQQAHQAWINNEASGQGGLGNYTNTQQSRYNDAYKSGDQDLIGRLQADSQRVGYQLNAPPKPMTPTVYAPAAPSGGPSNFTAPTSTPAITPAPPAMPVRDRAAIEKYVQDQIAAKLLRSRSEADQAIKSGKTTAGQQLGSLKTQFDRTGQDIQDNRTLENAYNERNLNPFSGKSDFARGMIERERGRTDRERTQDFETRQANVNADLANLESTINSKYAALQETTGAERERLQREIEADERQYELAMRGENRSDVLANSNIANQEFGQALQTFQTNRGVYESDRNFDRGVLESDRNFGLQDKQSNWNAYLDSVGMTGNTGSGAKADWSLLGGTGGTQTLAAKSSLLQQEGQRINNEIAQLELSNLPAEQKLRMQQLQKQIADIGRAPYRTPEDAEFDKIKLDTAKEQLKQLQGKSGVDAAKKMESERSGLTSALNSGDLSYSDAVKSINNDKAQGFYTASEAAELMKTLETWAASSYGQRWN